MLKEFASPNMAFFLVQEPIRTRLEADEDEDFHRPTPCSGGDIVDGRNPGMYKTL